MSDSEKKRIHEDVKKIFQGVDRIAFEADPFLETRVLAQWRERKGRRGSFQWWRNLALGSSALSLLLITIVTLPYLRPATFEAFVNQPFVVKIEVADLSRVSIAKAQIELPDGISFDIEEYPELRQKRTLTLHWRNLRNNPFFPFVLTATQAGAKKIIVRFFDSQDGLVAEKTLTIDLKALGAPAQEGGKV